jgi:O-antigen ligase
VAGFRLELGSLVVLLVCGGLLWLEPPGTVGLLALGVAFLAAAAAPAAAVAAAVASLPLTYRPVTLPGGAFSLLELAILAATVGTALSIVWGARRPGWLPRVRAGFLPWETTIAAAWLLVAGSLSLAFVAEPGRLDESLRGFRWTIVEPLALFVVCRFAFAASGNRLAVAALVAVGAATGLAAVGEALLGNGLEASGVTRATLLYPHPNNLAFLLERVAVFATVLVLIRWRTVPAYLAAGLALAGVGATFSRGAWLGVAVAIGAVLARDRGRRKGLLYLAAAATIVLGSAAIVGERLLDPGGNGVEATRLPIWRSSLRMIADHPWTGVGLDQFYYQYWRRYVEPAGWPERYTSHPHDLILDVWLSLGILGPVWLVLIVGSLIVVGRRWQRTGGVPVVAVAAAAALAAGAVHGLVDNGYFLPDLAAMTWILIALMERPALSPATDRPRFSPDRPA